IEADIKVYDDSGQLVAEIYGFRADRVEQGQSDDLEKCLYQAKWEQLRLKGTREAGSAQIPATTELVAAANVGLPELYAARGLNRHYETFLPAMEEISRQFIANAYIELGWQPSVGDRITVDSLMRDLMIADHH